MNFSFVVIDNCYNWRLHFFAFTSIWEHQIFFYVAFRVFNRHFELQGPVSLFAWCCWIFVMFTRRAFWAGAKSFVVLFTYILIIFHTYKQSSITTLMLSTFVKVKIFFHSFISFFGYTERFREMQDDSSSSSSPPNRWFQRFELSANSVTSSGGGIVTASSVLFLKNSSESS